MKFSDTFDVRSRSCEVAKFMKCFANSTRMMILCLLVEGEKNVGEIIEATGVPQASVSQHLSTLKDKGLVSFRREHRNLYYRIADPRAYKIMEVLYALFCAEDATE